jgi:hypothetical protein
MKKRKRKSIGFRMNSTRLHQTSEDEPRFTLPQWARLAMQSAETLTPLFLEKHMSIEEALALTVMYTDAQIMGQQEEHSVEEKHLIGMCGLLLSCWDQGLFVPSSTFPYTLEDAKAAWGEPLPSLERFKVPFASRLINHDN